MRMKPEYSLVIIETGNQLNVRKVLISLQAILKPDWEERIFPVNLQRTNKEQPWY